MCSKRYYGPNCEGSLYYTAGVDLAANKKNFEIQHSTHSPKIYVALGIHPGNIKLEEVELTLQFIRDHIKEAVAVGETGLDYWYKGVKKDETQRQRQRDVFQKQLHLAKEFNLPVVIHSRGAWRDCLTMTQGAGIKKAVFHWYSGPLDVLKEIMECGYYVGTTPSLAYSPQSREAMLHASVERTLMETDSPVSYGQAPTVSSRCGAGRSGQGEDGFRAEPQDVFRTLKAYAQLKEMSVEKVQEIVIRNAKDFFEIV